MARSGPCSPYVTASELLAVPAIVNAIAENNVSVATARSIAVDAVNAASEILYIRSGRVYTGVCGPVTIRPVARPINQEGRLWLGGGGVLGGGASWGAVSWYQMGVGSTINHFGDSTPPELPLPDYPVLDIVEVKIDGVVIPSNEYRLDDYRTLIRMRPTASSTPTERWGWPTAQIDDLPDTEEGTFSITYTFGQDPGVMGRLAARKLAEFIALPAFGQTDNYPNRMTNLTRQGVTVQVADAIDLLSKGSLGITEVEEWLTTVNPGKNIRQATVWSPDIAKARRVGSYPSLP
jgi:hypothetical protein